MKKIFFMLTIALGTLITIAVVLVLKKENGRSPETKIPINELFKLEPLNHSLKFDNGLKLLVVFSPDCEFCNDEFLSIDENWDKLREVQIILYSPFNKKSVTNFIQKYNFCNSGNTTILIGRNDSLTKILRNYPFPTIFITDKDGNVKREFKGSAGFNSVLKVFREK